jgi:transposase
MVKLLFKQVPEGKQSINYLVFDSKFTNYENLTRLDDQEIKFITSPENQIKVELKKKRDLPR